MEKYKEAYNEILEVLRKHKDLCNYDISDFERISKSHLFGLELKKIHGLNIIPENLYTSDWNRFGDYRTVGMWGQKHGRTISWSDDGSQPEDELLLNISFPTGAYIFGDDYPVELFKQFFDELKTYNPKYLDTNNKSLYFSMDNAKYVFNEFGNILAKYNELNREDYKQRKIKKLQEEINKLQ